MSKILDLVENASSKKSRSENFISRFAHDYTPAFCYGALALAFQKYPYLSPAEMKLRLYERAYPRGEQLGRKCWGMIHVDHLVRG